MKKIFLLSAVVAGLVLSGCGEKKSEEVKKVEEPKKVEKAKEENKKVVSVKEKLQMPPMPPALPATAFNAKSFFNQKCASCHGPDGKRKALGKSGIIAGMAKDVIIKKLKGYKLGKLNQYGMGPLMKAQVASLSDAQIEALAGYIASLK